MKATGDRARDLYIQSLDDKDREFYNLVDTLMTLSIGRWTLEDFLTVQSMVEDTRLKYDAIDGTYYGGVLNVTQARIYEARDLIQKARGMI